MCFNNKSCCKGMCGCTTSKVGKILVIIGGINWGLVGLGGLLGMDWNLVGMIFGFSMTLEYIVYLLVGVSAVVWIFGCPCNKCKNGICEGCAPQDSEKNVNAGQSSNTSGKVEQK